MLQTKFCGNRSTDSGEDFEGVIMWMWRQCLSCDPDIANKFSFPTLPKEAPHKIWL